MHVSGMNGAQGLKNRRGELQRVLSREESYVDGKLSRAAFISIAILTFITFVGNFTQLQLSSALPIIVSEFHISVTTGQWLTSVFQLVMGVMVPLTAFLTRRFSTRQIVICSMAVFTLGSVLAWLGPNFVWVLVGRVLEAAGTGVMWPVLQITVFSIYPLSRRGFAMGTVGMAMSVAPAIGPTVGGAVTTVLPWRAIFVIAIPLVLIAACIGMKCIEQKTPTEAAYLDPIQLGSIVVALVGLVLALNQGGVAISAAVSGKSATRSGIIAIVSLIAGLALLIVFAMSSKRAFSPLLRLGILKDPAVLLHACAYLLLPLVAIGYGYVITNVAQLSLGTTAFVAGSLVLPGALVGAVCAPLGGWFYDKFGAVKPILIPIGIAILGPVLMLVFSMQLTPVLLAGFYFIFGLFYSIGNANVMTSGLSEVSPEFKPDGNAIFNTCLQFGGAAGTALFSTILSVAQAGAGEEGTAEFAHATAVGGTWTFATMTVICLIGWCCLATAFRIRAARKRA